MNAPAPIRSVELRADPDAIRAALETIGAPYHLFSAIPDGPVDARHFGDDIEGAVCWAVDQNMRRNAGVYWSVNAVRNGLHDKAKKADIVAARFLHVDIDPPKDGSPWSPDEALSRLQAHRYPPSFVIASGGGLGAFWRLDDETGAKVLVETANQGLEEAFGGDHCWNVDRVMRLPGAVNWPDRKKIARGRAPALATMLIEDDGVVYPLPALAAVFQPTQRHERERAKAEVGNDAALLTADDLGLAPFDSLRSLIEHPRGNDRSIDAYACAGRMARDGYSEDQIFGVLMNPANAVHAHIGDQRDPRYAALRAIEGTKAPPAPEPVTTADLRPDDLLPLSDLSVWAVTAPTPKTFIAPPFIPAREVTLLTGDGGANKSTAALQLGACMAAGKPFLGIDVTPGPALFMTVEDDDRENHWRLDHIARAIGVTLHDLAGKLHVASLRGTLNNDLATFDNDGRMRPSAAFHRLHATIRATGARLVVLDNVAHLFAGNENDRGEVTAFVNLLYALCVELGVSVILIAHRNKVGDTYSGSTAWPNAVRSQVVLELPSEVDRDARRLTLGKANYARKGETLDFRWHDFALVRDSDLPADQREEIAANVMAASDNATFLNCLRARNQQHRAVSEKVSPTYAPKVFADMAEAKGVSKKRLELAMDRLFRIGAIERAHLWDGDDRKPVHGLRETAGDAENACGQHGAGDVQSTAGDLSAPTVPNTYTYTTYTAGASLGGAAPATVTGRSPDLGAVRFPAAPPDHGGCRPPIFAPDDNPDDPVPGWEDL